MTHIVIRGMEYEHTHGVPGRYGDVTLGYELRRIQETFDAIQQAGMIPLSLIRSEL